LLYLDGSPNASHLLTINAAACDVESLTRLGVNLMASYGNIPKNSSLRLQISLELGITPSSPLLMFAQVESCKQSILLEGSINCLNLPSSKLNHLSRRIIFHKLFQPAPHLPMKIFGMPAPYHRRIFFNQYILVPSVMFGTEITKYVLFRSCHFRKIDRVILDKFSQMLSWSRFQSVYVLL
jgi:hypothetical protein